MMLLGWQCLVDSYCCGIQLGFIVRVNTHFAQNDYIRELS